MRVPHRNNPSLERYYAKLAEVEKLGILREEALRPAFGALLDHYAPEVKWVLVLEERLASGKRPDGTFYDSFKIPRGYWEAKDTKDDLEAEIAGKLRIGYPTVNTIFEDTRTAVLYQNRQRVGSYALQNPEELAALLNRFFSHTDERIEEYHRAVQEFSQRIPDLAKGLTRVIEEQRTGNPAFVVAFEDFHELCRSALNPQVRAEVIEEMLVQHLLTDRLFQTVFDNPEFTRRNVIAAEIEKVIGALTSTSFSKQAFLRELDYFYQAIEETARTISDWSQKQAFLNDVYERFFQDFSRKTADTHGIVYTPQEIVDFMCQSVEDVLASAFGQTLSQEGVTVLDPCTGTGNFLVNLLRRVGPLDLTRKFDKELFANEVMLLPYYVASLNLEHAYFEIQGKYRAFPGLSFADTLDMAEGQQLSMFAPENLERVERQKQTPITVVIGNPPYNVGQQNENDNNKNRTYPVVDKRIKETYIRDSSAQKTKAYAMEIRFFRWATDRLKGQDGIVCFVTNNGFAHKGSFDGMRKSLLKDFDQIYHLDLHGDVRENPKLSGTTHNVFGIQVGVGITIAIRKAGVPKFLKYHRVPDDWTKRQKLAFVRDAATITGIEWETLEPDAKGNWITEGMQEDFAGFLPIGTKEAKAGAPHLAQAIFQTFSLGVSTNRDPVAYDFSKQNLEKEVREFLDAYHAEVDRYIREGRPKEIDSFVGENLKWSRNLKTALKQAARASFDTKKIRDSLYRPFSKRLLYHGDIVVDEIGLTKQYYSSNGDNVIIIVDAYGRKGFSTISTNAIPNINFFGDPGQCFPLYVYDEDGTNRRENITDWALDQFRSTYGPDVTKEDIFYYVYALLHHPEYRTRYAENLKRELPRVPLLTSPPAPSPGHSFLVGEEGSDSELPPFPSEVRTAGRGRAGEGEVNPFHTLTTAGRALAALHIGYETVKEYPLGQSVNRDVPFTWRVTRMKLSKDRESLQVNDALTFTGIPADVFEYKLGNRSALEWVIDQYQVSQDKRTGMVSDPNRTDDPEYIARLVRRVITVSLETVTLVKEIAALPLEMPATP